MKRKNLMLGLAAFTLAITSAFATTMFVPEQVFLLTQAAKDAPWVCRPCNVACDNTGTQLCLVQVITGSVGPKLVQGRRQGCQVVLFHTSPVVQPCASLNGIWDVL